MAVAGGTARSQEPLYYAVNEVSELDTVLSSIQARVILSCDITLAQEPPDKGKVNIYFDQQEIAQDTKMVGRGRLPPRTRKTSSWGRPATIS